MEAILNELEKDDRDGMTGLAQRVARKQQKILDDAAAFQACRKKAATTQRKTTFRARAAKKVVGSMSVCSCSLAHFAAAAETQYSCTLRAAPNNASRRSSRRSSNARHQPRHQARHRFTPRGWPRRSGTALKETRAHEWAQLLSCKATCESGDLNNHLAKRSCGGGSRSSDDRGAASDLGAAG